MKLRKKFFSFFLSIAFANEVGRTGTTKERSLCCLHCLYCKKERDQTCECVVSLCFYVRLEENLLSKEQEGCIGREEWLRYRKLEKCGL